MRIILDASEQGHAHLQRYLEYGLFPALASAMPEARFMYPHGASMADPLPANMFPDVFPAGRWFHQHKMKKWLRQQKASAFISFYRTFITKNTKNILIVHDDDWKEKDRMFSIANHIGVISQSLYDQFIKNQPHLSSKTFFIDGYIQERPSEGNQKDIKTVLTDGREYFIAADFFLNKDRFVLLLKAFSIFKRMQQSNWKFMIVLRSRKAIDRTAAESLLKNYTFRKDIVLTDDTNLDLKMAQAYCLVSTDKQETFPVVLAEAAIAETPAIALSAQNIKTNFPKGFVFAEGDTPEAIGKQFMRLYKEETLRYQLKKELLEYKDLFTAAHAARQLIHSVF